MRCLRRGTQYHVLCKLQGQGVINTVYQQGSEEEKSGELSWITLLSSGGTRLIG